MAKQFLRLPDVKRKTGLGKSAIYALMQQGRFPLPVDLTGTGRAKAWVDDEIDEWGERRIVESRGGL